MIFYSIRFTELKHMEEDEAYLKDFGLSTPQFMQLDKTHEEAQNIAQKLASANVEKKKEIDEVTHANQELYTEFEAKQTELKQLVEAYKQKKEEANCEMSELIKIMSKRANELNKESSGIQRKFKRGEISAEEYVKTYKATKTSHSKAYYTQLAL